MVGKYSKSAKASQVLVEALLAKSSQPSFEIYPDEEWKLLNESCIQAIDGSEPNSSDKARALADCSQVADMAGKPNMAIQMLNASLTIQPNQQFWLVSRGIIKEGAFADIVLFDPNKIKDRSDFKNPKVPADGIDYVLVNGRIVWSEKMHSYERPGKFINSNDIGRHILD